jgi:ribosomal protein S18 acetylase RimI-like enzyme
MTVRSARPEDAHGIARVHIASWQAAYRGLLPDTLLDSLSLTQRQQEWQEILSMPRRGHTLVYTEAEQVVGFAACGPCRDADLDEHTVGEIYAIYLDSAVWSKGYGKALMQAALAWLQQQQYHAASLWVLDGNQRAIRFYIAAGFVADGVSKEETLPGGIMVCEWRYRRPCMERG